MELVLATVSRSRCPHSVVLRGLLQWLVARWIGRGCRGADEVGVPVDDEQKRAGGRMGGRGVFERFVLEL